MKIILVCSAGMSTSLLVNKMKSSAEERNIKAKIKAVSELELGNNLLNTDVILIGPQVRYLERKINKQAEPKGIKVDIIEQTAYGLIQGDKVLEQAIALLE